jgi:hypothetical protein
MTRLPLPMTKTKRERQSSVEAALAAAYRRADTDEAIRIIIHEPHRLQTKSGPDSKADPLFQRLN